MRDKPTHGSHPVGRLVNPTTKVPDEVSASLHIIHYNGHISEPLWINTCTAGRRTPGAQRANCMRRERAFAAIVVHWPNSASQLPRKSPSHSTLSAKSTTLQISWRSNKPALRKTYRKTFGMRRNCEKMKDTATGKPTKYSPSWTRTRLRRATSRDLECCEGCNHGEECSRARPQTRAEIEARTELNRTEQGRLSNFGMRHQEGDLSLQWSEQEREAHHHQCEEEPKMKKVLEVPPPDFIAPTNVWPPLPAFFMDDIHLLCLLASAPSIAVGWSSWLATL